MGKRTEAGAELVARARHDRAAFGQLYWLYAERVYAFCLAHTGNREMAEDLTSFTFEHALRKIGSYEDRGHPFSTWLIRIAANGLAERVRQEGRVMLVGDAALLQQDNVSSEDTDPARWVDRWEQTQRLLAHMAGLSADQQFVLWLHFWEDRTLEDAAIQMGRSAAATRQLLHRALAALRIRVMNEDGVEDDRPRVPRDAGGRRGPGLSSQAQRPGATYASHGAGGSRPTR